MEQFEVALTGCRVEVRGGGGISAKVEQDSRLGSGGGHREVVTACRGVVERIALNRGIVRGRAGAHEVGRCGRGAGICEGAVLNVEVDRLVGSAGSRNTESRGVARREVVCSAKRGVANGAAAEGQREGDIGAGAGDDCVIGHHVECPGARDVHVYVFSQSAVSELDAKGVRVACTLHIEARSRRGIEIEVGKPDCHIGRGRIRLVEIHALTTGRENVQVLERRGLRVGQHDGVAGGCQRTAGTRRARAVADDGDRARTSDVRHHDTVGRTVGDVHALEVGVARANRHVVQSQANTGIGSNRVRAAGG